MDTKITVLVAVALVVGVVLGNYLTPQTVILQDYNQTPVVVTKYTKCLETNESDGSSSSINIPAVDEDGVGVVTTLDVQIVPGAGRILANIDKLLFWVDTQNSIRTARKVASDVTGVDLSQYDIIYTVRANASVIEGPSAGAALTVATIAAIEQKELSVNVMMTGSVNHDGTIGPVGEILPKAQAARDLGADIFLVPLLQGSEITYKTEQYCEQIGMTQICTTETRPVTVDIEAEAGIEIIEVKNINEALEYFIG